MYDLFIIHAARHVSLDKQGWGVLSGRMQSEKEPRDVWLGSTPRPESYYATTYYEPDGWLLVDQKAEIRVGSVGVGGLLGGSVGAAAGWPAFFVGGAADGSNLHLLAPCLPVAGGRNGLGRGVAQAGVSVQGSGSEDREEQAE